MPVAPPRPAPPPALLCRPGETPLFACAIGGRHVAVCGSGAGATYRFGRPGRIELATRTLALATRGFAGGGESQITATADGFSYTLFDRTTRDAFAADGRHDAEIGSGLIVRHAGRTLATRACAGDAPVSAQAARFMPLGPFVAH